MGPVPNRTHRLLRYTERFKRLIAGTLLVLTAVVVLAATVELVVALLPGGRPTASTHLWLTETEVLEIFGVFLTVLIALELVETVEVYFREHVVHAEVVLLVALIALGRKFVVMDAKAYQPMTLMALGAITLALGLSYFLIRRAGSMTFALESNDEDIPNSGPESD